jgi:hypothetical protein
MVAAIKLELVAAFVGIRTHQQAGQRDPIGPRRNLLLMAQSGDAVACIFVANENCRRDEPGSENLRSNM